MSIFRCNCAMCSDFRAKREARKAARWIEQQKYEDDEPESNWFGWFLMTLAVGLLVGAAFL